jgi:NADH-quinone oxidoreductase subunit E
MLTEQERSEIDELLRHNERPEGACVEALKVVQKHRGWVSDDAVADVAAALGRTADEVDAVATFYDKIYRRPVGRHVILVCDSISCWIMGAEGVLAQLKKRLGIGLGETTPDGRFTLLPNACLGACDHAPALMIDDNLHGDVTTANLDAILERYP